MIQPARTIQLDRGPFTVRSPITGGDWVLGKRKRRESRVITFSVPGEPVGQPRAHPFVFFDKRTGKYQARMTPPPRKHAIHAYRAAIRLAAKAVCPSEPLEGPVAIRLVFVMARPKRKRWKVKATPRELHTAKPDYDNLAKAVCDALNGVAWRDDSQLAIAQVEVYVASGSEGPHTEITIEGADLSTVPDYQPMLF